MRRKNKHVNGRMYRTQAPISKYDIQKSIIENKYITIKKVSVARRLAYVNVNDYTVKIIIDKKTKNIITILPMNYDFNREFICIYNNKKYKIVIYPDCYMETMDCRMMTSFFLYNDNTKEWVSLNKKGKLFKIIFESIWYFYMKYRNYSNDPINTEEIIKEIRSSNIEISRS